VPRLLLALLLAVLAPAAGAASSPPPETPAFSAAQRADIKRIQDYLNGLTTLEAHFLQISSNGGYAEGTLYMARPGKLRIQYDPPVPVLMVAAGGELTYYDKDLKQVTTVDLSSTPAAVLVGKHISFSKDIRVSRLERGADALRITLVRADDPHGGSIALVFSDHPLILKKWTVVDAQGIATTVSLLDPRFGIPLDPALFRFVAPLTGLDAH